MNLHFLIYFVYTVLYTVQLHCLVVLYCIVHSTVQIRLVFPLENTEKLADLAHSRNNVGLKFS